MIDQKRIASIRVATLGLVASWVLAACSAGEDIGTFAACAPGATQACLCPPALNGVQLCSEEADSWGDCDCGAGPGTEGEGEEALDVPPLGAGDEGGDEEGGEDEGEGELRTEGEGEAEVGTEAEGEGEGESQEGEGEGEAEVGSGAEGEGEGESQEGEGEGEGEEGEESEGEGEEGEGEGDEVRVFGDVDLADCEDRDHDGYGFGAGCFGGDFDDLDARVHPGALEVCDGVDNDGDGAVDGADADYRAPSCELGVGVCEGSTARCAAGEALPCADAQYGAGYVADEDRSGGGCDGRDNDCGV